uniref:Uncharacterized protein n=1 Tax=Opuntia streptacantha TaxID=393608 RepID=A0A7C8YG24_OPUST
MGIANLSYEEYRQKRVEENKKRLEDLNLVHLSQTLRNLSPKSSPVKSNRISSPRKSYGVPRSRDLSNRVYATDEARAYALEKAEKLVSKLEEEGYPTLIRSMLPSHVTGGFWLVIKPITYSNLLITTTIFN